MTQYAKNTKVGVMQTRGEIQAVIARFGGQFDGFVDESFRSIVCFRSHGRWVRFVVPVQSRINPQRERELWRGVLVGIKGRLINVQDGVETFEEAFFAHIVTESGQRVYEEVKPKLKYLPATVGHNAPR